MNAKLYKIMNEQIRNEWYSAYLYMSMSAHFTSTTLSGFANWMRIQAQEEFIHGQMFYNHLLARGEKVKLLAVDAPPSDFTSPKHVFKHTLEHEKKVTALIHNLVKVSREVVDPATENFLQWFVNEQVEEEANATEILGKLELIGDNTSALFLLDKDLAARVFVPPTPAVA